MSEQQQPATPQQEIPVISEILSRGLQVLNKITAQEISVNETDMINLLNFKTAVNHLIKLQVELEKQREDAAAKEESQ